jgi:hypothetical protein
MFDKWMFVTPTEGKCESGEGESIDYYHTTTPVIIIFLAPNNYVELKLGWIINQLIEMSL